MPLFSFFRKKDSRVVPEPAKTIITQKTVKPASDKDTGWEMTGWDWFGVAASLGVYGIYLCCYGKKTKKAPEQLPVRAETIIEEPIPTRVVTTEAKAKTDDDSGAYASLTAKLSALKTELETWNQTSDSDLSKVREHFALVYAECEKFPSLRQALNTIKSPESISSNLDRLDYQLAILEKIKDTLSLTKASGSSERAIVKLQQALAKTILIHCQLRTRLIFGQHEDELTTQLRKPAQAHAEIKKKLKALKSDVPAYQTIDETAEIAPYDINSINTIPELTVHNDPKKFLGQRGKEFSTIQQTLQSMVTQSGISEPTIPDYKASEIEDEEDAEIRYMEDITKKHGETITQLHHLKSSPLFQTAGGEIDSTIESYRPVVESIKQGKEAAATYRRAELMGTIRQNPGLNAYYEQLKELLKSAILGAHSHKSGFLEASKDTSEQVIAGYVTTALGQVPLPGMDFACSVINGVGEYVGQLRQEARVENVLGWSDYVSNDKWLQEFALFATIAKRKEITEMTAKTQDEVDKPSRIKELKAQRSHLKSLIGPAIAVYKKSKAAAEKAQQAFTEAETKFKGKLTYYTKYYLPNEAAIKNLEIELNRSVREIEQKLDKLTENRLAATSLWALIKDKTITNEKDKPLVGNTTISKSLKKLFCNYLKKQCEYSRRKEGQVKNETEVNKAIGTDSNLIKLRAEADAAAKEAHQAKSSLDKLKAKQSTAKQTLQSLQGKSDLTESLKKFGKHLQSGLEDAITAGIRKSVEKRINPHVTAGKSTAIQDFAALMTNITNEGLAPGHNAESAKSRLMASLVNQNPEKPDIDIDPVKTSGQALQDYFFFNRKRVPSEAKGAPIIKKTNSHHFDFIPDETETETLDKSESKALIADVKQKPKFDAFKKRKFSTPKSESPSTISISPPSTPPSSLESTWG